MFLISCANLHRLLFLCAFAGVLDEILNRLKFHTPVGATILQNGGGSKPAMHFIDENDKLQAELKVKKGMLLCPHVEDFTSVKTDLQAA